MEERKFDWLNNKFLTQCLQKEEGMENAVVLTFKAIPAVPPGYNYLSVISRVRMGYRYTEEDDDLHFLSLIIKSELTDESIKQIVIDDVVFGEVKFYDEFLPEVERLTYFSYVPKSFKPPDLSKVVLEDLDERGFVNIDKLASLDFEHCRWYLIAAASLHAVSFAVHKDNPQLVEYIGKEKWFADDMPHSDMFRNMVRSACKVFIDMIEKTERFKKHTGIIKRATEDLWIKLVEIRNEPSRFLNVLNHGDAWVANMMFRYDERGSPEDIALLDFQLMKYGSPACDLVHFLWTSATHEVRRNRLEDLYHVYLDTFNYKLEELGCSERLSYENLKAEIERFSLMAVFIVGIMQPYKRDQNPLPHKAFLHKDSFNEAKSTYENWYNEDYINCHFPNLMEALELAGVFGYLKETVKS